MPPSCWDRNGRDENTKTEVAQGLPVHRVFHKGDHEGRQGVPTKEDRERNGREVIMESHEGKRGAPMRRDHEGRQGVAMREGHEGKGGAAMKEDHDERGGVAMGFEGWP